MTFHAVRTCTRCRQSKSYYEFYISPNFKQHSYCNSCRAAYMRAWQEANRGRARAISSSWNKRNPEAVQAARDRYNARKRAEEGIA